MGTRLPMMRLILADLLVFPACCRACCCCANLAFNVSRKPGAAVLTFLDCCCCCCCCSKSCCFLRDFGLMFTPAVALPLIVPISLALSTAMKPWPTPPGPCPWLVACPVWLTVLPLATLVVCALTDPRSWDDERAAEQERSTDERVICSTALCWMMLEGLLCPCCCPVVFRKSDGLAGVWRSSVRVLTVSETEMDLQKIKH